MRTNVGRQILMDDELHSCHDNYKTSTVLFSDNMDTITCKPLVHDSVYPLQQCTFIKMFKQFISDNVLELIPMPFSCHFLFERA